MKREKENSLAGGGNRGRARRTSRFDYKGGRGETQFINFPGVQVGYFGAVYRYIQHRTNYICNENASTIAN